ncbi:MAG: ArsR/SmtB family transcription factor [Alphaproteobacteria bacterium]
MERPAQLIDLNDIAQTAGHIEASALLKAMSNESRLMILCQLIDHDHSVNEIEKLIGLSQSAISQHLAILRDNDLVSTERCGQSIRYSINGDKPRAIIQALHRLFAKECA